MIGVTYKETLRIMWREPRWSHFFYLVLLLYFLRFYETWSDQEERSSFQWICIVSTYTGCTSCMKWIWLLYVWNRDFWSELRIVLLHPAAINTTVLPYLTSWWSSTASWLGWAVKPVLSLLQDFSLLSLLQDLQCEVSSTRPKLQMICLVQPFITKTTPQCTHSEDGGGSIIWGYCSSAETGALVKKEGIMNSSKSNTGWNLIQVLIRGTLIACRCVRTPN